MQLVVRDLATGLGLTGLIVSPAFGYAGVGFPVLGMNAFALFWGAMLPLRWYMAVLFGQAARGLPLYDSARPFALLAALATLYTLLAFLRLRSTAGTHSPWSASRPGRSATCSKAPPSTFQPLPTRPICSSSDRWRTASRSRSTRYPLNLPLAARARTAVSSRRRSRRRAPPRSY